MAASLRRAIGGLTTSNARNGIKKALVPMLFVQNMSSQSNSHQSVGKHLELHLCDDKDAQVKTQKPLAVIFNWLMAKRNHVMKFGDFYKMQGFDVLTVSISPFQLLFPVKGSQVVATSVLDFLAKETAYQSVVVHGFSVGGYVFGEALLKIKAHPEKYGEIPNRIVGQVFDSAVDYYNIPIGIPRAVTKNVVLRKTMETYIRYHMKTFYTLATQHYLASSEMFHHNYVRSPALFFFSRDDPVGTEEGNMSVVRDWEANGTEVFVKSWDRSSHVAHLFHHREEYLAELAAFLERIDLLRVPVERSVRASKL